VRHRVSTLRASCTAACRDYRLCIDSLDGPTHSITGESITLADTISANFSEAGINGYARSPQEREELRIDVARVISNLPQELSAIVNLLQSEGVVETANQLRVPRATLYRRLATIRRHFVVAGLDLYVRVASTASKHCPPDRRYPSPSRDSRLEER
jgi:hypothetical protein